MDCNAKLGDIWLVAIPILTVKNDGTFDTAFQIRPFLIVDEGKGVLVEENSDYLASKITTKKNNTVKVKEIANWKELGLNQPSFVRIEIPERIEKTQLLRKICSIPDEQFLDLFKEILSIFNTNAIEVILSKELQEA